VESILPYIVDLKKNMDVLISRYNEQREQNESLTIEKISLLERITDLKDEIKELKKRVDIVDMAKGIGVRDENSVTFARDRVNTLIRQIDKCISLLNE
jgi:predicted nuclease with TOPRIM domain